MPQLHLNQGPQDALLYDNSRSYFTNVGYVRTSNFQMELRDIDPQNTAALGTTVQFVIPKAGDLLGPCDLMLTLAKATAGTSNANCSWIESVGYGMIERITFSVGSNDIETIEGDELMIINELMKTDEHRLGSKTILKTGRPSEYVCMSSGDQSTYLAEVPETDNRTIYSGSGPSFHDEKKLIVPLGLFFTKHPSQYFPLAAVAGCNDVRVSIKFRPQADLLVKNTLGHVATGQYDYSQGWASTTAADPTFDGNSAIASGSCKLRCHFIHTTGPEATALMNKEHVRLLKLWQKNSLLYKATLKSGGNSIQIPMDLSFLHPVNELIITIRKASDMDSSTDLTKKPDQSGGVRVKNRFAYHGGDRLKGGSTDVGDPNFENLLFKSTWTGKSTGGPLMDQNAVADRYLTLNHIKLTLNGQERNPGLAGQGGIDRDYLVNRLMPMLHSNTSQQHTGVGSSAVRKSLEGAISLTAAEINSINGVSGQSSAITLRPVTFDAQSDTLALAQLLDRKNIFVYPFSLNPEGQNPSGAVNFSKVSHAKLTLDVTGFAEIATVDEDFQIDVYATYYNWLQIKDGRALLSFA